MKRQLGIFAMALLLAACGSATDQNTSSTKKIDRSEIGNKADNFVNKALSCAGACDSLVQDQSGYCGCDDLCDDLGDCCLDKADLCDAGTATDAIVIDQSKDGQNVTIDVGETIDVQLEGNPSTGYGWELLASNRSFPLQKEEYVADEPQITGSGGTYHFYFTADTFSSGGTFELNFAYFRSWEGADSAIETFSVIVTVMPACSPVMCEMYCPNGFVVGADGCEVCQCKELDSCGGIAGLLCPDDFFCKMEDSYPDAMGVCVPKDEMKTNCLAIQEDYTDEVGQSQGCMNDDECQAFVGGNLTCGHPLKAINTSAKEAVKAFSDKWWDDQCYKLDWNCPMFSPLPPWYTTMGVCKQSTCQVEYIDTRATEGDACTPGQNYQCGDALYCSAAGTCVQNGSCDDVADCANIDNGWFHPACVGFATCEQSRCGWNCLY